MIPSQGGIAGRHERFQTVSVVSKGVAGDDGREMARPQDEVASSESLAGLLD